MAEKIINYIKSHTVVIFCAVAVLVAFIIVMVFASGGSDDESNVPEQLTWGEGITENIPEFEGTLESSDIAEFASYAAAYYSGVSGESVEAYVSKLETELGIKFNGDKYPRSAIYGEKIIVVHYNVTEMRLSVTVTEKSNGDNYTSENENDNQ